MGELLRYFPVVQYGVENQVDSENWSMQILNGSVYF